jgi:hypothetical protein
MPSPFAIPPPLPDHVEPCDPLQADRLEQDARDSLSGAGVYSASVVPSSPSRLNPRAGWGRRSVQPDRPRRRRSHEGGSTREIHPCRKSCPAETCPATVFFLPAGSFQSGGSRRALCPAICGAGPRSADKGTLCQGDRGIPSGRQPVNREAVTYASLPPVHDGHLRRGKDGSGKRAEVGRKERGRRRSERMESTSAPGAIVRL